MMSKAEIEEWLRKLEIEMQEMQEQVARSLRWGWNPPAPLFWDRLWVIRETLRKILGLEAEKTSERDGNL